MNWLDPDIAKLITPETSECMNTWKKGYNIIPALVIKRAMQEFKENSSLKYIVVFLGRGSLDYELYVVDREEKIIFEKILKTTAVHIPLSMCDYETRKRLEQEMEKRHQEIDEAIEFIAKVIHTFKKDKEE